MRTPVSLPRLLFTLFAVVLLGPSVAQAASGCAPDVTVRTLPLRSVERSDLTIREVTALNQGSTHALTRAGHGLGSTVVKYLVNARVDRDLVGCPRFDIEIGYETVTLYIAQELRENPCAYEHVRRHELHHLAIAQRWLRTVPTKIRARWTERHEELVAMGDAKRLASVLDGTLAELRKVQSQQDDFDSPDEYRTNSTACGGAIDVLLKRLEGEGAL